MTEVFSIKGVPCERCRGYRKRKTTDGRVVCADCERKQPVTDFLRCWLICTDDVCMLGYGTTRSQAVDDFLGRYTDNTFDEFAAGYLGLRINRVPEHDPGFDTPRLEYSALATIRRGYSVHCEGGCGNESLVASLDQWPGTLP